MHIFVDESGNFTRREDGTSAISAVGALVIKDSAMAGFRKLYGRLRKRLPKDGKEVKGRLLNEAEVAQVCKVLKTVGAIFEVVATDLALQSDEEIEKHQSIQAEKITENLTDEFSDDFKEEVWDLRKQLEAHPKQLYLQSVCMSELIHSTLNHADVYHSLRFPRELGSYTWRIDAKGRDGKTNWEEWWEQTLLPILESKSVREPFMRIESGDYSAQDRFKTKMSEFKCTAYGLSPEAEYVDMSSVMKEDFAFSSEPEFGLEAVDVLTNAIRRSLMGHLQAAGWKPIRQLMIHRSSQYIRLVTLGSQTYSHSPDFAEVIAGFTTGGRSMLTKALYRKGKAQSTRET